MDSLQAITNRHDTQVQLQHELISLVEKTCAVLNQFAIHTRAHSPKSIALINHLDTQSLTRAISFFKSWLTVIEGAPIMETNASSPKDREIHLAKYFLQKIGQFTKDDIWSLIEDNDVIEIYTIDGIQIYRSLNFFSYCSYTLLDIATNEWFALWERPKAILEKMHLDVTRVLSSPATILKSSVPKHLLKETSLVEEMYGEKPTAALVEFKYLAPLTDHVLKSSPTGFLCTASGEIIAEGSEIQNILFV